MTPAQILRAAKEKIASPEAWTQKVWARDREGKAALHESPEAVCWCAQGAILAADDSGAKETNRGMNQPLPVREAIDYFVVAAPCASPISFNDTHTHSEVLEAFDRAIALAEEKTQ